MIKDLFSSSQNKWLWAGMLVLVVLFAILQIKTSSSEKAPIEAEPLQADTVIPEGYVLLPLQLENIENLASLIDTFGVIDLYGQQEEKIEILASRLKILQAPLNPNQYAVLAPHSLSRTIMRHGGPYWGTVRNRHEKETEASTPIDMKIELSQNFEEIPAKKVKRKKRKPAVTRHFTSPTTEVEYYHDPTRDIL